MHPTTGYRRLLPAAQKCRSRSEVVRYHRFCGCSTFVGRQCAARLAGEGNGEGQGAVVVPVGVRTGPRGELDHDGSLVGWDEGA